MVGVMIGFSTGRVEEMSGVEAGVACGVGVGRTTGIVVVFARAVVVLDGICVCGCAVFEAVLVFVGGLISIDCAGL
jgi:hypothetical protein